MAGNAGEAASGLPAETAWTAVASSRPIQVACPLTARAEAEPHMSCLDPESGVWWCDLCEVGGTVQGFSRLVFLEAERYELEDRVEEAEAGFPRRGR